MEILQTQGICMEASLASRLHTNYPCPFCHTDFINQEDVIEHMEICSVTDPEANLSLLPANHLIWQNWEAQWNSHYEVDLKFNNNEELTGLMNISSLTDFELPVHRPIYAFCQQPFERNDKVEEHINRLM